MHAYSTAWHAHPDTKLEEAISTANLQVLEALLRHPMVKADRYAHLRVLDRLHGLLPQDPSVLTGWMQAMLLSNRPAPVWAVVREWPYTSGGDPTRTLISAQVAQVMGETQEARARYRHLLGQYPEWVDAWQKYLEFEDQAHLEEGDIRQLEKIYRDTKDYEREKAAFALSQYYNQRSPGHAFILASEAHKLKRQRIGGWDAELLVRHLKTDRRRRPLPDTNGSLPQPIFVVGLPRSGTTLLTRLLGSHSQVSGLGEQNLIPNLAGTACRDPLNIDPRLSSFVQAWYRAAVGDLTNGARVVVDKLPANVEHIGLILSMFPDARIIHLERALPDCAMSIHLRDFEFGCRYSDDANDLAIYVKQIDAHVKHWLETSPSRVMRLRYEALARDPSAALAPVLAMSGLTWEPDMLDFWRQREQIATFSEGQVRRPLNGNSIDNWRRFLPEAGDHLRALGITV